MWTQLLIGMIHSTSFQIFSLGSVVRAVPCNLDQRRRLQSRTASIRPEPVGGVEWRGGHDGEGSDWRGADVCAGRAWSGAGQCHGLLPQRRVGGSLSAWHARIMRFRSSAGNGRLTVSDAIVGEKVVVLRWEVWRSLRVHVATRRITP
jgi:hypothetical protein